MEKFMRHRTVRTMLMGLGGLLVFTALVAANQVAMPDPMSSTVDKTTAGPTQSQESTTGSDPMPTLMDTTPQSHNAAQMYTTLAQAQPPLTEDHMTMCMNMMHMMQQMHGGMGGHTNEKH